MHWNPCHKVQHFSTDSLLLSLVSQQLCVLEPSSSTALALSPRGQGTACAPRHCQGCSWHIWLMASLRVSCISSKRGILVSGQHLQKSLFAFERLKISLCFSRPCLAAQKSSGPSFAVSWYLRALIQGANQAQSVFSLPCCYSTVSARVPQREHKQN